jgi:cytochrome c oxidase subunit 2
MLTPLLNLTTSTLASTAEGEPGFWFKTWLGEPTRSPAAGHTDSTYMYLWWFCVAWFVFLMGLMFYFVIAYRRRPGKIAQRSTDHNSKLEIFWTIIPTLMLVHIFWIGFDGYMDKVTPPGNAMELKVTGYKWSWDMEYPGGVVVNRGGSTGKVDDLAAETIPIFYVPADTPIRLRMNSTDVMHAFWIPNFRVKSDLIPNRYTGMWFQATLPASGPTIKYHPKAKEEENLKEDPNRVFAEALAGEPYEDHWLFCAEYCGTGHSEMAGIIRVVSAGTYKKWLDLQGNPPGPPEVKGERIYKARCISCHSVDGSSGTGPTWKNMYGYEFAHTDGTKHVNDDQHIAEAIRYPNRHIRSDYPAGGMSAFPESLLSNQQVDYVIAYMKTLSDRAPATTPEEAQKQAEPEKK